jgi:hypothetical protein
MKSENPGPGLGQAHNCGRIKSENVWFQILHQCVIV